MPCKPFNLTFVNCRLYVLRIGLDNMSELSRPAGLLWDRNAPIGIPAEGGYTTLQPVSVTRVRNDQNQGSFRINVYDPSYTDLSTARLTFEIGLRQTGYTPGSSRKFSLGKSAKSLFRQITLRAPNDEIIDQIQEYNHVDSLIRDMDSKDYVNTTGQLMDGSRVFKVGRVVEGAQGVGLTQAEIAALGTDAIDGQLVGFKGAQQNDPVSGVITDYMPSTNQFKVGNDEVTKVTSVTVAGTLGSLAEGILTARGQELLVSSLPNAEPTVWHQVSIDLNELSLFRSGKMIPLSILRGSGFKLDFEMANSRQCLVGNMDNVPIIELRNIQLRLWRQTFQDTFNISTQAMLQERGALQIPSTKWIASHGQKPAGIQRIVLSQTATSIKHLFMMILPSYQGTSNEFQSPFMRSVGNVEEFQLFLGGKEVPNVPIRVVSTQSNSFEQSQAAGVADTHTWRYWNGHEAIYEYMRSIGKIGDRDYDSLIQPFTWGLNHYNASGAPVDNFNYLNGGFVLSVDLEPYMSNLRNVGLNTAASGVPIEIRLRSTRTLPQFDYVCAMLVDCMNIMTADGGVTSVF